MRSLYIAEEINQTLLMKKKECPSCAMNIDAKSKACPICGYEFAEHSTWVKWVAIVLLIVFLLSYFVFNF